LHVKVPTWWEETVLSTEAESPEMVYFSTDKKWLYSKEALGIHIPGAFDLVKEGDRSILTVGGNSVALPPPIMEETNHHSCLNAVFDEDRAYVAVHGDLCSGYPLYCIDRKTGETQWASQVWCTAHTPIISGYLGRCHVVSISVVDRQVVVFGADWWSMYLEVFNATDGTLLCRFSTNSTWELKR
jgi:hypothetical protein